MYITVICPNCNATLHIPSVMSGSEGGCAGCGARFIVPALLEVESESVPTTDDAFHSRYSRAIVVVGSTAAVMLMLIGLAKYLFGEPTPPSVVAVNVPVSNAPAADPGSPALILPAAENSRTDDDEVEELIARVEKSVVTVEVHGQIAGQRRSSIGSGFLVHSAGTLVTNFHVMEGAVSAKVVFADNSETPVLGFRTVAVGKDLVILAIDPQSVSAAPIKLASEEPGKGSRVYAFGSPKELKGTVTDGVVSALRRGDELAATDSGGWTSFFYDPDANWIQTTAPISHGNSGGPLVNRVGELIGVNTWKNLEGQNLNFAIAALHVQELTSIRTSIKPLSDLPTGPQTKLADAAKKARSQEEAVQAERLSRLKADEARDLAARERELAAREAAREAAASKASEERAERAESESRLAAQLELNRMNERMITVKNDLRVVESQGESLTLQRADVFARGQAVSTRGNQLKQQITFGQNRLGVLANVIRSRELAANGGPIFLDSERGTTAQLRQEMANIEANIPVLKQEAGPLEATYLGLDQQARNLGSQIAAKVAERTKLTSDLKELERQYGELLGKTSTK